MIASKPEFVDVYRQLETTEFEGACQYEGALAWREAGIGKMVIATTQSAKYLIEAREGQPCLVSRFCETPPRLGADGPQLPSVQILRSEATPSSVITIGEPLVLRGLSRKSRAFDPDSLYQTATVVSLSYL